MQQLLYTSPGQLEWREAPPPAMDSERSALVRPLAVATCDIDAMIVQGLSPFPAPFPLGHECVAEVVDAGERAGVATPPGTLVSVPFQISCGECASCLRGRSANCSAVPFMSTYGFGPAVDRWGGFLADTVHVPYADHMLVALPGGLAPADVASASDNIADAWRAVGPALEREPGAEVLVVGGLGPGSIGLYAAAVAVALGAARVLYVDTDERRCERAAAFGCETSGEIVKRLGPFGITVDACGTAEGIGLALRSTAPDGTCTSCAVYFAEQPALPLLEMYTKGITFVTGRANAREAMPHVLALAAAGALHPEHVTSKVVPWPDAPDALLESGWTKLVFER